MRLVAFSATIGGMCVFALMIGIISDTIGEKVDELKKGKSRVIEKGHTLLLGQSTKEADQGEDAVEDGPKQVPEVGLCE